MRSFSSVYENDKKNFVLKVTNRPDPEYQRYVDVIKKFDNKHFPKISNMKKLDINCRDYYVYAIEKLKTIHSQALQNLIHRFFKCETEEDIQKLKDSVQDVFGDVSEFLEALKIVAKIEIKAGN